MPDVLMQLFNFSIFIFAFLRSCFPLISDSNAQFELSEAVFLFL